MRVAAGVRVGNGVGSGTAVVDGIQALRATNDKFERRFGYIERQLATQGRKPTDASLVEMEALWQEAKTRT